MQTQTHSEASKDQQLDEELADTLTAISVVSKRLAQKIKALSAKEQEKRKEEPQMSKMSELSQVISELKDCGKTLINIADSLTEIFSSTDTETGDVMETPSAPLEDPKPALSFLDVRKKFADMSRAGHTEALKELLKKYGADKLSSIDPSQYAALLADAEAIQ
ncbi:hypothetical protein EAL2_808p01530 (plasmid) [Peptoclostridium acidaminophilum DSM 3953]|uniref:DNA ligase n=1 Tax=Peptoclostridium acidaminophilum DSM 3953 TaxID=1286171 RepID=W8TIP9_PEPAC|nr:hypothetical protein [Peptoclostridium acidaminophilum]AHM57658.1 hypothetical protein EAL2_808p01530 [Peptoclostridium acidaminophilum DSM 3953]